MAEDDETGFAAADRKYGKALPEPEGEAVDTTLTEALKTPKKNAPFTGF
jgi:hypothetical protein